MKRKLLPSLFFFPFQLFFFLFFGCWVGQPAQAKDIAKNISRNVAPNAQKRGKLFVYLGTTYSPPFSGKSSQQQMWESDQHLSTIILLWPPFGSFFTISTYIIFYHVLSSFWGGLFGRKNFFFICGEEESVEVLS